MQFFKILVILLFSVDLFFFLRTTFLSCLSTDLHQIWHELYAIKTDKGNFCKVKKPGHNGQNI